MKQGERTKRRVVFIIDRIGTSHAGTENQLLRIVEGLDPQRYELHLICFANEEWFAGNRGSLRCITHLIGINRFKRFSTYLNIVRLVRLLRGLSPDIVHTFFPVANIVGVLAARLAGIGGVISSRRDFGEWMRADYLLATRFANIFVKTVLANSDRVRDLTVGVERIAADRVDVIYNGIDISQYSPAAPDQRLRTELGIAGDVHIVGIVANFRPMKRHETFVRAAQAVLAQRQDVAFLFIGTNAMGEPLQEKNEALADELGIRGHLHFLGPRKDVRRILSIMDVGVNCSQGEGLSNAIIEYMATGVPCVVSDSGGNPDLITKDVHGAVFPLDDSAALAAEILRLLADEELRLRFKQAARRRIESEMSLPVMLGNMVSYYEHVIADDVQSWRTSTAARSAQTSCTKRGT